MERKTMEKFLQKIDSFGDLNQNYEIQIQPNIYGDYMDDFL